jgi:hypothetical protein
LSVTDQEIIAQAISQAQQITAFFAPAKTPLNARSKYWETESPSKNWTLSEKANEKPGPRAGRIANIFNAEWRSKSNSAASRNMLA